jgi:signal transduction histidine kinase
MLLPQNNRITRILALIIILVGVTATAGWVFDVKDLHSPGGTVSMKFGTAISFVFSGVILYYIARIREGRYGLAFISITASGFIISLFMATVLVSNISGVYTGMETLFVREGEGSSVQTPVPGRPSVGTMIDFILIILIGVFVLSDSHKLQKSLNKISIAILIIGGIATIGYVVNLPLMYYYYENISTAMAIHTSVLFVLFGIGMLTSSIKSKQKMQSITIKKRLISLFLITSLIPIIFIGMWSYNIVEGSAPTRFGDALIIIGSVTAITTAIFAFLTTKSLLTPLINLKTVTQQAAGGDLDVKASEEIDDEIGDLSRTFNTMLNNVKLNAELKIETETLRQIDKEKEEFSAMISHELKTPLVPIQGYSELLLGEKLGELTDLQRDSIKIISNNSERLLRLIQDILDARKMELGRLKLDIRDSSTKEIVTQCLAAFKTASQEKGVMLVNGSQDIKLKCDTERIIQVINNLMSNSLKFVPSEKGKIEIGTRLENESVIFNVRDNGVGIPKDKQDNLFKKFYQIDTSLGRRSGGSGLGLVICKGIVESHNGKMWVESEPGIETTFYFLIPRGVT